MVFYIMRAPLNGVLYNARTIKWFSRLDALRDAFRVEPRVRAPARPVVAVGFQGARVDVRGPGHVQGFQVAHLEKQR